MYALGEVLPCIVYIGMCGPKGYDGHKWGRDFGHFGNK